MTRTISPEQVARTQLAETFPVLDTMRAVGALAVLTTHVAFWAGDYQRHGAWGSFLARLDVGVAIFFVLSGFLLSRPSPAVWLPSGDARPRRTLPLRPAPRERLHDRRGRPTVLRADRPGA